MDARVMIQELAKALATQNSIDKKVAQDFVQTFFQVIIRTLKQDKYVKVKGLGTFKQIEVESRESMNIHTGERFEIQEHMKISFTPDGALKDAVNKPFAHFETIALNDDVTDEELEAVDQAFEEQEEDELEEIAMVEKEEEKDTAETTEEPVVETAIELVEETPDEEVSSLLAPVAEPVSELVSEVEKDSIKTEETPIEDTPVDETPSPVINLEDSSTPFTPKEEIPSKNQEEMEDAYYDEEEEEEYDRKHRKYYAILTTILVLAALAAGYGIGYLMESSKKPAEVQVLVYDTVYVEKKVPASDSVKADEPSIQKDETTPPLNGNVKMESTTAPTTKMVATTKPATSKPIATKTATTKPATTTSSSKTPATKTTASKSTTDNHSQYPQLAGGAYWITGTAQTYKLRKGETIRIIAERFFGSRQMALYIEKYNGISDPDHVAEGTVLNIPKLQKK